MKLYKFAIENVLKIVSLCFPNAIPGDRSPSSINAPIQRQKGGCFRIIFNTLQIDKIRPFLGPYEQLRHFYYYSINTECYEIGHRIEASQNPKAVIRRLLQPRKFRQHVRALLILKGSSCLTSVWFWCSCWAPAHPPGHPDTNLTCQI